MPGTSHTTNTFFQGRTRYRATAPLYAPVGQLLKVVAAGGIVPPGVNPATLRRWEREGYITPVVTNPEGGAR